MADEPPPLGRLAALLPPPPDPRPFDRAGLEALPADFRAFIDRWGEGAVSVSAFTISVTDHHEWHGDALRDFMDDGHVERRPVWPDPGGVRTWGSTESTKWTLMWDTNPPDPDAWRVLLLTEGKDFVETDLSFAEYLVGALAGELPPEFVPEELQPGHDDGTVGAGSRGHVWDRY